jgi:hypothetical protein
VIEYERGLTIAKAIEIGLPLRFHVLNEGRANVLRALDVQLTRLSASINVKHNLSSIQIKQIANDILEVYPTETIEDFMIIFKRARQGFYKDDKGRNEIFRLDQAVIFGWIDQHVQEKAMVLEELRRKEEEQRNKIQGDALLTNEGLKELYQNALKGKLSEPRVEPRRSALGFQDKKYNEYRTEYLRKKMIAEAEQEKIKTAKLDDPEYQKQLLNENENGKAESGTKELEGGSTDENDPGDEQTPRQG